MPFKSARSTFAAAAVITATLVTPTLVVTAKTAPPLPSNQQIGNIIDTALNAFRTTEAIMQTTAKDPHVTAYYKAHSEITPLCTVEKNRPFLKGHLMIDFFTPLEENVSGSRQKFSLEDLGYRLTQADTCLDVALRAYKERRQSIIDDYNRRLSGETASKNTNANFATYFIDRKIKRFENSRAEIQKMLRFFSRFGVNIGRRSSDPSPWPKLQ